MFIVACQNPCAVTCAKCPTAICR